MALPSNVDHGTVVGFFEDSFGNALAGSVTFTPQFTVARDASATPKTIILPSPVTAALTQGAFSVLLVATDDPDIGLTTWNYVVTPKFTGPNAPSMSPFPMYVPMGTTTDLADVITVPSTTGVLITKGDKGDPGADGVIQSVVAGTNVTVDATDPANPVVSATGGGGGTALTSYATQVESLSDYPAAFPPDLTGVTPGDIGAAPTVHTHTASQVTDFASAVDTRVQNVVGAAPAALDTLAELANALGDDADFAGTVTTALATKYVKPGTGIPETDLATAVQTSLGKADTATQPADVPFGPRGTVLSTTVWPARPSSRTDIYFDWIDAGGLGTDPPGWLDGDSVLKAA